MSMRSLIKKVLAPLAWPRFLLFRLFPGFERFWVRRISPFFHPAPVPSETPPPAPPPCVAEGVKLEIPPSPWGRHVLLVTHIVDGTGGPLLALYIAKGLAELGLHVHIFTLQDGSRRDEFAKYGPVSLVPSEAAFAAELDRLAAAGCALECAYLNTAVSGRYAGLLKSRGMRVVTLVHEFAYAIGVLGLASAVTDIAANSDRVVIPSTLLLENWKAAGLSIPEDKVVVMPQPDYNKIPAELTDDARARARSALRERLGIQEQARIVMGCGTVEHRKGCDTFFNVAEQVRGEHPDVCFVWIGGRGEASWWTDTEKRAAGLGDNARLLPYQVLDDFYQGADVFFLPSREDPFPTVALMAAKHALPVVHCTGATGVRDLFGGIGSCAVPAYSENGFAESIAALLRDASGCVAAGRACREAYYDRMPTFRTYVRKLHEMGGGVLREVSCVIPNYNYADYLERRLKSIAEQTYPVTEVIFLDDNSTDGSDAEIRRLTALYADRFPRGIRYVRNTENAGVFRQWRRGAELAVSPLLWVAEADDLCSPYLVAQLVHAFDRGADVRIAHVQSLTIDGEDNFTGHNWKTHTDVVSTERWLEPFIRPGDEEIGSALAIRNTIPNASAALFSRQAVLALPEELYSYRSAGDWFAYLNMVEGGSLAFSPEPLNYYRRHQTSVIAKQENRQRLADEVRRIHEWAFARYRLSPGTARRMKADYELHCQALLVTPERLELYDDALARCEERARG